MALPQWVIGALLNIVGSVSINLGTNLVKLSHRTTAYRSPWFHLGFALFCAGNVLNFISMGYTAQMLLAALGSVQFLTNVVFGRLVLGERVTWRTLAGTALIVAGNALIFAFASHESNKYSLHDLISFYTDTAYIAYLGVAGGLVVVLQTTAVVLQRRRRQGLLSINGCTAHYLLPFAYAMVSGLVGTQSVVLAKSLSVLFRQTVTHSNYNMFTSPPAYAIMGGYAGAMVFWLGRLNHALVRFDGLFIVPCMQVIWTVTSVIAAGIYFHEFDSFPPRAVVMFLLGIVVVLGGVVMLAPQPQPHHTDRGQDGFLPGRTFSVWTTVSRTPSLEEMGRVCANETSPLLLGAEVDPVPGTVGPGA